MQIVRACVGVVRVVGRDAARTEVEAESAVRVDRVGRDEIACAGGNVDALRPVESDGVGERARAADGVVASIIADGDSSGSVRERGSARRICPRTTYAGRDAKRPANG